MRVVDSKLDGAKIIEPIVYGDERGFFLESFNLKKFQTLVCNRDFVQDNHSLSKKGILRGLHVQTKNTQGKLVRVVRGEVFDVIVDLRKTSSTYLQWQGFYLSAENKKQLWVPEGFAHGFYVTSDFAEFVYKCTDYYNPNAELTLSYCDEKLNIQWPIVGEPILSEKDKAGISLSEIGVEWDGNEFKELD